MTIEFLKEHKKLGTAGALSLLPDGISSSILVINGDVLTSSDFVRMAAYHREHSASITVAAISHTVEIPYGVIRTRGAEAIALEEKPTQNFLCNAGIYILSPEAQRLIPGDDVFNMTDLIERAFSEKARVAVFPLHEFWADIGNPADLARVRQDATAMSIGTSN